MNAKECPDCTRKGFAPDNAWPVDEEFWPTRHGRMFFARCRACQNEIERNSHRRFLAMCRKHRKRLAA